MGILPIPRSLRKHLMVNGLYKVLLRFYLPSTISRLFPPQLIDTQIRQRLEDTLVIFQPLLLSTSRSKRLRDVALSRLSLFYRVSHKM